MDKTTKKKNHTAESLQAELQYMRDVYGQLRAEIRSDEQKITSNLNYTLAGAGVVIAVSSFIASSQQYYLFLVLPFLFFVLAFSNFENHLGIAREGNYLRNVVYPRIREIIVLLGEGAHDFGKNTLDWEFFRVENDFPALLTFPISASNYGLHILFSAVPVVFFFYYKQNIGYIYSPIEIMFLALDIIGFVVLVTYLVTFRIWASKRRRRS